MPESFLKYLPNLPTVAIAATIVELRQAVQKNEKYSCNPTFSWDSFAEIGAKKVI